MSISTNIYRTKDILHYIYDFDYKNPNELEDVMVNNPLNKALMCGSENIKLVILDTNKVSVASESTKKYLKVIQTEHEINKRWVEGYRIKYINDLRKDTYLFRNIKFDYETCR